jgi:hypothetical protein
LRYSYLTLVEVRRVNRKILLTVLALAAVLLATPCIGMAHATASTTVSGTIEMVMGIPADIKPKGQSDNLVMIMDLTEHWQGGIEGISTTEATWMLHNWVPPAGGPDTTLNIHEKLVFQTVTVLDETGTIVLKLNIENGNGYWTIISGTGGLANLHGQGTVSLAAMPYTYTGQVHFDP